MRICGGSEAFRAFAQMSGVSFARRHIGMRALPEGVDSGVGPSRAVDPDLFAGDILERAFDPILDGFAAGLALPSAKGGSVIRDDHFQPPRRESLGSSQNGGSALGGTGAVPSAFQKLGRAGGRPSSLLVRQRTRPHHRPDSPADCRDNFARGPAPPPGRCNSSSGGSIFPLPAARGVPRRWRAAHPRSALRT